MIFSLSLYSKNTIQAMSEKTELLKNLMAKVAEDYNSQFKDYGNNVFSVDVQLVYPDGTSRYQLVFGRLEEGFANGEDTYYFNSKVSAYTPGVDLYLIMKEAAQFLYSTATFNNDKTPEGAPCEMLILQSSPIAKYCSLDMAKIIIFELASKADRLEKLYFIGQGDRY